MVHRVATEPDRKPESRLESAKAHNTSLAGQRHLLEQLLPLVTQLEEKGVTLNGSFLVQKILAKFTTSIQRKVLEHRMTSPMREDMWKMKDILTDIDKIIDTEERINRMVHNLEQDNRMRSEGSQSYKIQKTQQKGAPCIFCNSHEHKAAMCPKYDTIQERRNFFREHNKCMNCGTSGHFTKDCTKEGCRLCDGKKHHHTLCPQRTKPNPVTGTSTRREQENQFSRRNTPQRDPTKSGNNPQQRKLTNTLAHMHSADTELCEAGAQRHRQTAGADLYVAAAYGAEDSHNRTSSGAFLRERTV
ncbi:zinc knuckle, partial [Ostertagia ostertagi]